MLLSCTNCSFNPLQADGFGAPVGYCTSHRRVLHQSHSLTCGQLLRKDLLLPEARRENALHLRIFAPERISLIRDQSASPEMLRLVDSDVSDIARSPVGRAVTDFAAAGSDHGASRAMFLAQLAQLARTGDGRAELAQHTLGRVYVDNCVRRDGAEHWTSGIHLLQWTKELLPIAPVVTVDDLPDSPLPNARKRELAQWDILMLRLTFLSDMGHLAPDGDPVAQLRDLPERAARATSDVDFAPLMQWISVAARKRCEAAFPTSRYHDLWAGRPRPRAYPAAGSARVSRASEPQVTPAWNTSAPRLTAGGARKPRAPRKK